MRKDTVVFQRGLTSVVLPNNRRERRLVRIFLDDPKKAIEKNGGEYFLEILRRNGEKTYMPRETMQIVENPDGFQAKIQPWKGKKPVWEGEVKFIVVNGEGAPKKTLEQNVFFLGEIYEKGNGDGQPSKINSVYAVITNPQ
ncbi:hypothetical protein ACFL24_01360 [Patescibacteria group bacterium]